MTNVKSKITAFLMLGATFTLPRIKNLNATHATRMQSIRQMGLGAEFCDFANERSGERELCSLPNEFVPSSGGDGWVCLSPYGRWDHKKGTQVFSRIQAEEICNEFQSLLNTPRRWLGIPWYIGHPDHPDFADKYTDTRAYGRIKALEAREEGLFANVKWSPEGEKLIESEAYHGHSVNWSCEKVGNIWFPRRLKSVGFTNDPNIPCEPVTLANEKEFMLLQQLIEKLGLGAEATEEDVLRTVDETLKAVTEYKQAKTDHEAAREKIVEKEKELQKAYDESREASEDLAEAEKQLEETKTCLSNERAARADMAVEQLITAGKITAADKDATRAALVADFDAKYTDLANAKPGLKTTAATGDLGKRKEGASAKDAFVELVNERMAKRGESWELAWQKAKKEHKELFDQIQ